MFVFYECLLILPHYKTGCYRAKSFGIKSNPCTMPQARRADRIIEKKCSGKKPEPRRGGRIEKICYVTPTGFCWWMHTVISIIITPLSGLRVLYITLSRLLNYFPVLQMLGCYRAKSFGIKNNPCTMPQARRADRIIEKMRPGKNEEP